MTHARALLPYALASVAVVVASAVALGSGARTDPTEAGPQVASAAPSSAPRVAGLSDPRMAYWRPAASGSLDLWVGDLDGGRRWAIATASADADLGLTRWSPDGAKVAYRTGPATIAVVGLDGSTAVLVMPAEQRRSNWKIVSYEWSPGAARIAATFRAGAGLSNESDVYVAEVRPSPGSRPTRERSSSANTAWERITTLGDAFAGRWIDADRLFIETASGMIAVFDLATKSLRPMTGMAATSPLVGRDGRVYFSGGRSVGSDVVTGPVASGWVWSATIDGGDLRRETSAELTQGRLLGLLADGRAVTGVPGGISFAAESLVPVAFAGAGTLRRVVVSEDGRRVIGITGSQILRIDPSRVPRTIAAGSLPPASAATTILAAARDADVWTAASPPALARTGAAAGEAPRARLAFVLGRTLWQDDPRGGTRPLLGEPAFFISAPRWSPSGERLAAIVTTGSPARASVAVSGPSGTRRWEIPALFQSMQWSPDGTALAFSSVSRALARASEPGGWTTHVYDAETGRAGERIDGRAIWTAAGRIVLTDGEVAPGPDGSGPESVVRVAQRIEAADADGPRVVTDARRLAATPLLGALPDSSREPLISEVVPSGDGAYLGVWLRRYRPGSTGAGVGPGSFVVIRANDGQPAWVLPPNDQILGNVSLSPVGHLAAWTGSGRADLTVRQAFVADPATGRALLRQSGRFAGWSPDGRWIYVARDAGLFAYPIDGGDGVRINSIGVPVAAAPAD